MSGTFLGAAVAREALNAEQQQAGTWGQHQPLLHSEHREHQPPSQHLPAPGPQDDPDYSAPGPTRTIAPRSRTIGQRFPEIRTAAASNMSAPRPLLLLCCLWHLCAAASAQAFPTAVNITWVSVNFKTILEWQPKPTNFAYTVEISGQKSDWKKKCIYTTDTECDVTDQLKDTADTYRARIISSLPGLDEVPDEPLYAVSTPFNPSLQTKIGKPGIKSYTFNDEKTKFKVVIQDPMTPYRSPNGGFESIRAFLNNDLRFTLYYWRASSTGKKQAMTTTNEVEITVDKGESYCFYVQATAPSRRENRESPESDTQCTSQDGSALDEYVVLVAVAIAAVLIVVIAIALGFTVYKCKKSKKGTVEKEHMPLNDA